MSPDYSVIGRRIRDARLKQKLTQEQLADILDISVAFLSRVETGKAKVNLKRLTEISDILKVTPAYLLTGSNTSSKEYLKYDFRVILEKCTPQQQKLIYQISELIYKTNVYEENSVMSHKK